MRKVVLGFGAAALALSLAACSGTDQPDNNIVAEDLNAMTNLEEVPAPEPMANTVDETPVVEEKAPAAKPAPEKPAAAKPAPAKPKAAEPKPTEPKPATPDCPPEHHAAGHC